MLLVTLLARGRSSPSRPARAANGTPGTGSSASATGWRRSALAAAGTWVWLQLPFYDWPWPLPAVAAAVLYGPVIGLVASQLVAAYLLVAGAFGVNLNELFAGQGIEDAKSFLRLRIDPDGTLTIYPIAVDRVSRDWQAQPRRVPAPRPG